MYISWSGCKPLKQVFARISIFFLAFYFNYLHHSKNLFCIGLHIEIEPYLSSVKNVQDRISMTKIRLSNHELMIEKGRHLNLEISERKCPFCCSVEDETHFRIDRPNYIPLKNDLLNSVQEKLKDEPLETFDT